MIRPEGPGPSQTNGRCEGLSTLGHPEPLVLSLLRLTTTLAARGRCPMNYFTQPS